MQSSEFKEMLRSTKGARQFRNDGYVNLLNRYGTSRDSSEAYQYIGEGHVPDQTFTNHYATDGLFAKIIDIPAQEAVKKGFKLNIEDEKIEEYIQKEITKLGFMGAVEKGLKWARLYGGALGVMIIDDGEEDLAKPVNWDAVKGIDEIMVFERAEVTPDYNSLYRGYGSIGLRKGSNFTMPEYYNVFSVYGSFRVHESRCLVFRNGIMPERTMDQEYRFWGIPEYNRIKRALRETVTAHSDAVKMLERMVQPIYKMKGLSQLLSTDAGEDNVLKRLDLVDKSRGILNSIAIDSENEDYDFKEASITGVKEVVDSTCNMLSALTEIPQTKLFGRSPAGMNATGDSDLENYYNFVDKIRETQVKGNLLYVVDAVIKIAINTGKLAEKPEYELEFEPLWNESESDKADVEQRKAQTDMVLAQTAQLYIDMGILDPSEERARLCKEGKFGITSEELPEQESSPLDAILGQMDHADAEEKPIERKTVAVIVAKDGEVLMGERTDNGKLCGPGGHIEDGETLEEAAAREAREEFGIEVKNLMPVGRVTDLGEEYEKPFIFVSKDFLGTPLKYTGEMKNIAFRQPSEDNLGSLYEPFEKSLELLVRGGNYPEISGNFTQNLFTNDEKNGKISIENTDNADGEKDYNTGKEIARWIRVNGAAIPLDKDGNALGNSELKGENFSEAKSEESSGEGETKKAESSKTPGTKTEPETENKGSEESGKQESETEKTGGEESVAKTAIGSFGGRTPEEFSPALTKAKAAVKAEAESRRKKSKAWRVSDLSPEDIAKYHPGAKLHITEGGSTVATDDHHDIFGVCHVPGDKVRGADLLKMAVDAGGDRLDSFDGNHDFYLDNGFEPISWCEFSLEEAPPDYIPGSDDEERVIFYRYNKNYTERPTLEEFCTSKTKGINYIDARDIRNNLIDKK